MLFLQVYIAEISPAHLRGMLGTMNQLAVTLGIILAYLVGYFFYWDWLALLGCIPSALLFIMMFWMPESPRWYLEKNRKSDALKSLLWLRGSQTGIEDECRETEATLGKVLFSNEDVTVTPQHSLKKSFLVSLKMFGLKRSKRSKRSTVGAFSVRFIILSQNKI